MMLEENEIMKQTIAKQTCAIVDGLKTELDKSNIFGDTHQATMISEEAKRLHEIMHTKFSSITSIVNGRVVYENPALKKNKKYVEALSKLNDEGRDEIIQGDNGESQLRR